jgi:Glycosyltransferase family 17
VIDTFPYNGEPVLPLRLQLLQDTVDEFVLVEARQTHSGLQKDVLFTDLHRHLWEPYQHKVTILIIDQFPDPTQEALDLLLAANPYIHADSVTSWFKEAYQRDFAYNYIQQQYAEQSYVVIVSDVDEIPRPDIVKHTVAAPANYKLFDAPVHLEMDMFYYNFRWQHHTPWTHAFVVNDRGCRRLNGRLTAARGVPPESKIVASGWHASYFFATDGIIRKLRSFAHTEFGSEEFLDAQKIRQCLEQGCNILGPRREKTEPLTEFDVSSLPQELQDFQTKLVFLQRFS